MKGLKATDEETVSESMKKADELIAKVNEAKQNLANGDEEDESLPKTKTGIYQELFYSWLLF